MRRFLTWSILAVVLGLAVAVAGYLAYDRLYARFQPVTIARNQGQIQRLLDEASWVSRGEDDTPLYVVGYRDNAATQDWLNTEAPALRAGGVEVRILMSARPAREGPPRSSPTERATIAELWLTRDWTLYSRWVATSPTDWTAPGLPPADGDLDRSAVVEGSRQFVVRLDRLMRDAGVQPTWPLILWRDREGFLRACACADPRSWAAIRKDLALPGSSASEPAPDAVVTGSGDPGPGASEPVVPVPPEPETPSVRSLPYPDLPPPSSPPAKATDRAARPPSRTLTRQPAETASPPRRQAAPSQATRPPQTARPAPPRPRPSLPQDSQFY